MKLLIVIPLLFLHLSHSSEKYIVGLDNPDGRCQSNVIVQTIFWIKPLNDHLSTFKTQEDLVIHFMDLYYPFEKTNSLSKKIAIDCCLMEESDASFEKCVDYFAEDGDYESLRIVLQCQRETKKWNMIRHVIRIMNGVSEMNKPVYNHFKDRDGICDYDTRLRYIFPKFEKLFGDLITWIKIISNDFSSIQTDIPESSQVLFLSLYYQEYRDSFTGLKFELESLPEYITVNGNKYELQVIADIYKRNTAGHIFVFLKKKEQGWFLVSDDKIRGPFQADEFKSLSWHIEYPEMRFQHDTLIYVKTNSTIIENN